MSPRAANTLWWSTFAVALGFLLAAVDVILLRRFLDRPAVLGSLLLALLLVVLAMRLLARRMPAAGRSRLQRRVAGLDRPALALVVFALLLLYVFPWGFARVASDGREYYVQTRSLVMDMDLDFANEDATFGTRGTASMYAFGMPLLWVPFFLFAHAWLGLLNLLGADYVRDGFFNAYQKAVGLGSLFYGMAGLWLLFRLAAGYVSRAIAAASVIVIAAGSFLLWYLVIDNSMSHATSMFAVALFVTVWQATREKRSLRDWALLGAAAGLMCMVRWQNLLWVVLPASDGAAQLLERPFPTRRWLAEKAAFGGAYLVAFFPQMYFWHRLRGGWLAAPAGAHDVQAGTIPLMNVLFSPDRGLFAWTPVLLIAMLGALLFVRRDRWLGTLLLIGFVGQVWINSTVEQGGHGFGGRKFANCAVLFVLGMATFLDWQRRRPYLGISLVLGWLTVVNIGFISGMRRGDIRASGMVPAHEVSSYVLRQTGNPFALPASLAFAWRHGTSIDHYERLGPQRYHNLILRLGGDDDARFLVDGWYEPEMAEAPFRWSSGPVSRFVAPLREADGYTVHVVAQPLGRPDGLPQSIEILANGQPVGRIDLARSLGTYDLPVPAGLLHRGVNDIEVRYAWTMSPAQMGDSEDRRQLAVAFRELSLLGPR